MYAEVQPIIQVLGGQDTFLKPLSNSNQLVQEIRKGISTKSVDHISKKFRFTFL